MGQPIRRSSNINPDALTRQRYEDPQFVREFRKRRGDHPRPYEARLLRRLLAVARSRRPFDFAHLVPSTALGARQGGVPSGADGRRKRHGLDPRQPLLVLDVGAGYGRDLAWLQAQPGVRVFGIDYSRAMLKAARNHPGVAKGTLAQMDVRRLGLRNACVAIVRAQALFHHLPKRDADAAMREIARVLRAGGLVRIFVRLGTWEGLLDEPGLGPRYFRYYTLRALRALLKRHGLRLIEHEHLIAQPNLPSLAVLAEKPLRRHDSRCG